MYKMKEMQYHGQQHIKYIHLLKMSYLIFNLTSVLNPFTPVTCLLLTHFLIPIIRRGGRRLWA